MTMAIRTVVVLALMALSNLAWGHELQTAAMRLNESANGKISATLNTPLARDGTPTTVVPVFDPRCALVGDVPVEREAGRIVREWQLNCSGGLEGTRLSFDGLDPRTPEALVIASFATGVTQTLAADRHDPTVTLHAKAAGHNAIGVRTYLPLGIEHILLGPDHLLFVFGLMLVVSARGSGKGTLLAALTAFTLAHSLTLGMAMFGIWGLPPKPVEILIALSIVLLAVELAVHSRKPGTARAPTLTLRKPWLVAFLFGLLHGFGFAGALSEIGLPNAARGWALLLFNLGVEIGQLLFVAAVLLAIFVSRRWLPRLRLPPEMVTVALGAVAVYWTLDRTAIWLQASGMPLNFGA